MDSQPDHLVSLRIKALLFRISAHIILVAIAVSLPSVGPNRFLLATLILCLGTPAAIIVNRYIQSVERNWAEALVDLVMIVTLIHLTPHLWMVGMALGLMVALAPSISFHPHSHWIYMAFGGILLTGMTAVALIHEVENWELVILAVTVTYPALLFYTFSQMQSANELRRRAEKVAGMTQLAGSTAHDFNNMLMGISGHTEVAMLGLPEEHASRKSLQRVLEGTKRASLLTNRLLRFAGREIGRKECINVVTEFREIADLLQPALPPGITVVFSASEKALYVDANISDLHQVWMNVLLNAGESMQGEKGVIDVHFSKLKSEQVLRPNYIALKISDRGGGISKDALEKIFDPFFTTKKKGHGLGLAVCKQIVQKLNGDISISDREGGGTEVLITCPEALQQDPNKKTIRKEDNPLQPNIRSMRIMVVDDEPDVREVAAGLLASLNHEALVCSNAEEAVILFEDQHESIDFVLLDLKMPGRDGWSCLQDLRNISAEKPVIICSGFNPVDSLPGFAENDMNLRFLTKPFQSELLLEALEVSS